MPKPHVTVTATDLATEHRQAKDQRATRWANYTPSAATVEPEFDEYASDEAERIARGLLHRRGQ